MQKTPQYGQQCNYFWWSADAASWLSETVYCCDGRIDWPLRIKRGTLYGYTASIAVSLSEGEKCNRTMSADGRTIPIFLSECAIKNLGYLSEEELVSRLEGGFQTLCIVNTRKKAQKFISETKRRRLLPLYQRVCIRSIESEYWSRYEKRLDKKNPQKCIVICDQSRGSWSGSGFPDSIQTTGGNWLDDSGGGKMQ